MLRRRIPLQLPAALAATLVYLNNGMLIGWSSPVVPRLELNTSHVVVTADEGSWLASVGALAAAPASLASGLLMDALGRRLLLLFAALPFLTCAVWQRFASTFWELLAATIIGNAGVGIVLPVTPAYMVEIAEDRLRGMLMTLCPLMAAAGSLLMIAVASHVSFFTTAEVMMVCPVVFVLTFWWMPESPYFLVATGRSGEAETALMRLRGKDSEKEVREELQVIQKVVAEYAENKISTLEAFRELRRNAGARRAFLVVMIFSTLVVLSGSSAMGAHSTKIFQASGSSLDADLSAIVVCSVSLLFALVSSLLVERAGRRPLLLTSFGSCTVTLVAVGVYFYILDHGDQNVVASLYWLPLTGLILFYVSYSVGANALQWAVPNELVPGALRGLSGSCVGVLISLLTFGAIKLFQVVSDAAGAYVMLWFFAACSATAFFFTWFFIPETKGRSLGDISAEMSARAGSDPTAEKRGDSLDVETIPSQLSVKDK